MQTSPSTIAREALRQLAARRLAPTPDNYTRVYQEIASPGGRVEERTPAWGPLIHDLLQLWDGRQAGLTQARKRESLEHVLAAFAASPDGLYARLRGLIRAWHEASLAPQRSVALIDAPATVPSAASPAPVQEPLLPPLPPLADPAVGTASAPWRELLAQVLTLGVVERLG